MKALEESNRLIGRRSRLGVKLLRYVKRTTPMDKMRRHGLSREVAYGEFEFGAKLSKLVIGK